MILMMNVATLTEYYRLRRTLPLLPSLDALNLACITVIGWITRPHTTRRKRVGTLRSAFKVR